MLVIADWNQIERKKQKKNMRDEERVSLLFLFVLMITQHAARFACLSVLSFAFTLRADCGGAAEAHLFFA